MTTLPERLAVIFRTCHELGLRAIAEMEPLYAPDMRFVDPIQDIRGRAGFLRMTERLIKLPREIRFEGVSAVGDESHFVVIWTMLLRVKLGLVVSITGVSECRAENGRIVFQRDYWDLLGSVLESMLGPVYKRAFAFLR
jgi:hypothetical protein